MQMQMDKAAGQLGFGVMVDFEQPDQIEETFAAINSLQALAPNSGAGPLGAPGPSGMAGLAGQGGTMYTLDGNSLKFRLRAPGSLDDISEGMGAATDTPFDEESTIQMLESMGLGAHDLVIHVPGKIKRVEGLADSEYTVRSDNTVVLTVDYVEMMRTGQSVDAVVRFKPKRKYRRVLLNSRNPAPAAGPKG